MTPVRVAPVQRTNWLRVLAIAVAALGGVVVFAGLAVFATGETLFGSDNGSIDSYNRDVLETCDPPSNSTMVRRYVLEVVDDSGRQLRTMSDIYASPLSGAQAAAFYQLAGPGIWTDVPPDRACRFGIRPSVLVLSLWTSEQGTDFDPATETTLRRDSEDEFWSGKGAQVTDIADPPSDTRSIVRLRLAQRQRDGLFGLEKVGR